MAQAEKQKTLNKLDLDYILNQEIGPSVNQSTKQTEIEPQKYISRKNKKKSQKAKTEKKKTIKESKPKTVNPELENLLDNYETIPTKGFTTSEDVLAGLTIKAVRESRKVHGKTITILHEKEQQQTNVSVVDQLVSLFDNFIEEGLLPMKTKYPEAFEYLADWIDKFGSLTKPVVDENGS